MGIQGTGLSDKNVRLRFFCVMFMGVIAFGVVLYWRQVTLTSAEYAEPAPSRKGATNSQDALRSENYELDVIESSPSVK